MLAGHASHFLPIEFCGSNQLHHVILLINGFDDLFFLPAANKRYARTDADERMVKAQYRVRATVAKNR